MLQDYLKAGYPALCCLTQEPHRAEALLPCEGWRFLVWDCQQGIRDHADQKVIDETKDPVGAINYLGSFQDTVLITHNLHLFLEVPEVIQSIQNGVPRWKASGCDRFGFTNPRSDRYSLNPRRSKYAIFLGLPSRPVQGVR
jgi:hypothetical protein